MSASDREPSNNRAPGLGCVWCHSAFTAAKAPMPSFFCQSVGTKPNQYPTVLGLQKPDWECPWREKTWSVGKDAAEVDDERERGRAHHHHRLTDASRRHLDLGQSNHHTNFFDTGLMPLNCPVICPLMIPSMNRGVSICCQADSTKKGPWSPQNALLGRHCPLKIR